MELQSVVAQYGEGRFVSYSDGVAYHYASLRECKAFANRVSKDNGGKPVGVYESGHGCDVQQFTSLNGRCRSA